MRHEKHTINTAPARPTASLLTSYYLLLTTYYPLLTTYYLLLTTYYLLLTLIDLIEKRRSCAAVVAFVPETNEGNRNFRLC